MVYLGMMYIVCNLGSLVTEFLNGSCQSSKCFDMESKVIITCVIAAMPIKSSDHAVLIWVNDKLCFTLLSSLKSELQIVVLFDFACS